MKKSRYRGFVALESMVVMLILLVLMLYTLNTITASTESNSAYAKKQQRFDKLVSMADYLVKTGLARESGDARYPNWIDESKLAVFDVEKYRTKLGLSKLSISFEQGKGDKICIYRLVVVGEQKEIKQLFVCGE